MKEKQPNIIIILMDTARASNFSCYGYTRETSPNIDKIAEKGILFENAFTTSDWTLPSHGALFTGLYPSINGLVKVGNILGNNILTLPEVIREKSHYTTVCITNNSYIGAMSGLNRGFDFFHEPVAHFQQVKPKILRKILWRLFGKWENEKYEIGAENTNKLAKKYIKRLTFQGKPFFMFLNYMDAHIPYLSPREFRFRFLGKEINMTKVNCVNKDTWGYLAGRVEMSSEDFQLLQDLYDGQLRYLDYIVGDLTDFLKKSGELDNTLLIITSDHGENLGEHNLMGHVHNLYDTVLRVPLVLHYPEYLTRGKRFKDQVSLLDLFPTVLEFLGISWETEKYLCGRNLFKSLDQNMGHEYVFSEYPYPQLEAFKRKFPDLDYSRFNRSLKAIRSNKYKYIWSSNGKHEFYDLKKDPNELNNLSTDDNNAKKALKKKLDHWAKQIDQLSVSPEDKELDDSVAQTLQALGYL